MGVLCSFKWLKIKPGYFSIIELTKTWQLWQLETQRTHLGVYSAIQVW